jgi:hypothetical protein
MIDHLRASYLRCSCCQTCAIEPQRGVLQCRTHKTHQIFHTDPETSDPAGSTLIAYVCFCPALRPISRTFRCQPCESRTDPGSLQRMWRCSFLSAIHSNVIRNHQLLRGTANPPAFRPQSCSRAMLSRCVLAKPGAPRLQRAKRGMQKAERFGPRRLPEHSCLCTYQF